MAIWRAVVTGVGGEQQTGSKHAWDINLWYTVHSGLAGACAVQQE